MSFLKVVQNPKSISELMPNSTNFKNFDFEFKYVISRKLLILSPCDVFESCLESKNTNIHK